MRGGLVAAERDAREEPHAQTLLRQRLDHHALRMAGALRLVLDVGVRALGEAEGEGARLGGHQGWAGPREAGNYADTP